MPRKTLFAAAPVVFVLALAGLVLGPGSLSSSVVVQQIAGAINPSATPTETLIPSPTATATATDLPTETATATATASATYTPTSASLACQAPPTPPTDSSVRVQRVPILLYHYVNIPPANDRLPGLYVLPTEFDRQMEWLAVNDYHPIKVADLACALQTGGSLPDKPIVLTFDDGYADSYQNAFPILKNYRYPATFYVVTQFADDKKQGYMTWAQIQEMARAGMEIGAHTVDHADLVRDARARSATFLQDEIATSKQIIELRLGIPVKTFAYPYGHYDARVISGVRSNGFMAAATEIRGMRQSSDKLFELKRIEILGTYNIADFAYWLNWFSSRPD